MSKLGPLPARTDRRAQLSAPRRAVLDLLVERQSLTVAQVAQELGQHPNTVREHLEALDRAGLARRDSLPPAGRGRPASVYSYTPAASFSSPEYAVLARVLVTYLARAFPDGPALRRHAREAGRSWGRAIVERDRGLDGGHQPGRPASTGAGSSGEGTTGGAPGGTPSPRPGNGRTDASRAPGPAPEPAEAARLRRAAVDRLGALLDRAGFEPAAEHDDARSRLRLHRCPVLDLAKDRPEVVCSAHLGMAREILATTGITPGQVSLGAFVEPGACVLQVTSEPAGGGDDAVRVGPA
ncbi:helix-turn-helix domain-containing protein [Georgenia sp. TF02-10]|uniref:helix-turn-helix transcriptional regulator n=1 Tax=Georgenia sp. TF02-10 TaxID=2917725 RepID=UPI001FA79EAA|nr:helix-turn-helix domain-containing protein [Georgenia sp. TF02-10]UNX55783.1 helix-turn-helix domain-containing protein [Georgenia sp. TF02-10]